MVTTAYSEEKVNVINARQQLATSGYWVGDIATLPGSAWKTLAIDCARQQTLAWLCQNPLQHNYRAELSSAAMQFIQESLPWVTAMAGQMLQFSPEASCYTYYQAGDYLHTHLDRPDSCQLTLLLYTQVTTVPTADTVCRLNLYANLTDPQPTVCISSWPNRVILLRGSQLPHGRPILQVGESVSLLAACYRYV